MSEKQYTCTCGNDEWPHEKGCPLWTLTPHRCNDAYDQVGFEVLSPDNPEGVWYHRPEVDAYVTTLTAELEAARARIKYAEDHGLQIGVCTSTDCPEGQLAHVYREGSTLSRMFDEWSDGIGLQSKLEASAIREAGLRGALEAAIPALTRDMDIPDSRMEFVHPAIRQTRQALRVAEAALALASAPADGWSSVEIKHPELPFAVPAFNATHKSSEALFVWYSWHPCYPYWSRSCWDGPTMEEAQKWKTYDGAAKFRIYWNKLVKDHQGTLTVVEDWLGDEALENWTLHRRKFDEDPSKYAAVPNQDFTLPPAPEGKPNGTTV